MTDAAQEREIENALVKHVTEFLLELGAGFAFVGRQVLLDVGGDEFFIDLLFYHLKLRCYVVIELKGSKFKPEHLGQLGFYLTAVDRQVKSEQDNPTIGLLLCKSKNKIVAEYALGDKTQPMGIAEYKLLESLPAELQTSLPSIEQIERELAGDALSTEEGSAPIGRIIVSLNPIHQPTRQDAPLRIGALPCHRYPYTRFMTSYPPSRAFTGRW